MRYALLVCLLSAPLWAGEEPHATVTVSPRLRGDVAISIDAEGMPAADLRAIVRDSMGCDLRVDDFEEGYLDGRCRRLLHSTRGAVRDSLALAPLAGALFKAGAIFVQFTLYSEGEPALAGAFPWIRSAPQPRGGTVPAWRFYAVGNAVLPPVFRVRAGSEWRPASLGAPLVFMLLGPALLACWVRRRMERRRRWLRSRPRWPSSRPDARARNLRTLSSRW